jgi:hypothetical protein
VSCVRRVDCHYDCNCWAPAADVLSRATEGGCAKQLSAMSAPTIRRLDAIGLSTSGETV